jgi:hypothetical protein
MTKDVLKLALFCIRQSTEYKLGRALFVEAAEDVEFALAAPVQDNSNYRLDPPGLDALYTTPPAAKRQWIGLTDEEIFSVLGNLQRKYNGPPTEDSRVVFALAIEAKLKEKNT